MVHCPLFKEVYCLLGWEHNMTEYDYTITPCAVDRLTQEIQLSSIVSSLSHINLFGTAVSIFFVSDLSANEKTTLDTIVANHTGIPLSSDFVELSSNVLTNTNSSNYIAMNAMTSPPLLPGTYFVSFTASIKTNAPLLSTPGFLISLFANGVQVIASEISDTSGSVSLFSISPIAMSFNCSVTIGLNQVLEVRWKTNGQGNTISCTNRVIDIMRVK